MKMKNKLLNPLVRFDLNISPIQYGNIERRVPSMSENGTLPQETFYYFKTKIVYFTAKRV